MNVLEDVEHIVQGGISAGSVMGIIGITLICTVALVFIGNGCLAGIAVLLKKLFGQKEDGGKTE